jgi:hypothetical protein
VCCHSGPVPDGGNSGDECMLGCAVLGAAAAAALHWLLLGPAFRGGRPAAIAPTPGQGTLWCGEGGDLRVRGGKAAGAGLAAAAALGSPQRVSSGEQSAEHAKALGRLGMLRWLLPAALIRTIISTSTFSMQDIMLVMLVSWRVVAGKSQISVVQKLDSWYIKPHRC